MCRIILAHFFCFVHCLVISCLINVNNCVRLQEIQNNIDNFAAKEIKSI
jgi:hypothetical protein